MHLLLRTALYSRRSDHAYADRQTSIPAWPLPGTGLPRVERRYSLPFPQLGLLIELAANEGRADEVLRWYDRRGPARLSGINDDLVADAVVEAYPKRAATIWQQLAKAHIAQINPTAYREVALFLRKLRRVWARQAKAAAWRDFLSELCAANRRKRRLVELLDARPRRSQLLNAPPCSQTIAA
jgi:uncharacterized Zn finger protein